MKFKFLFFFSIISFHASAQEIKSTTYLLLNNREVNCLDSADFVRYIYQPKQNSSTTKLIEKYKNGNIKKEGDIMAKEVPIILFEGIVKDYNLDGSIYSSETFKRGQVNGPANYYYPNGNLNIEGFYRFNRGNAYLQAINIYDNLGKNILDKNGNGLFERNYSYGLKIKGFYKNGFKDGVWNIIKYKTRDTLEEKYKNGKFYEGKITDINGNQTVFKALYTFPYCDGHSIVKSFGEGKMLPSSTLIKSNDEDGTVAYSFDIDRFGNARNFKLLMTVSDYSDKKALEYLKRQKWHPASKLGTTIDTFGFIYIVQYHLD